MLAALRLLTTVPVPGEHRAPTPASVAAFPLVGLVVGIVWALVASTSDRFLNTGVAASLVLVADALVTGALHLDGLADVADGLGSRRRGDAALAVMRDPSVGAAGALAVALALLVRHSALLGLSGVPGTALLLVGVPIVGRVAMVLLLALVPARTDGSLAASVGSPPPVPVALAVGGGALAVGLLDPRGLAGLLAGAVIAGAVAAGWRRRFGALGGDVVGACCVLAETAALLTLAATLRSG